MIFKNKEIFKNIFVLKNIPIFITSISILLSIILIITINNLNILPLKYYYLFLTTILIFNITNIILIKINKKTTKIINIILNILIIIISVIGIRYGKKTIDFINNSFNNNKETTLYSIVVLNSSNITNIKDLENKQVGHLKQEDNRYLEEIKINLILKEYETPFKLYDDLKNKKIDAIIINEAYLDLLEEYIKIDIKVIKQIEIKEEIEQIKTDIELKSINILISGSDSRSGIIQSKTRSDVNMIMTINPNTKTILLTSIPRDYYVQLYNTTGTKDKLTHSGIYGIDTTRKTLENLFNIKIDYSVKVGFKSVINIVDLVGGIDIYSDLEFTSHCRDGGAVRTNVKKGMNHFNGAQALSYARERYAYKEGDRHRILNQQQVLEAVIDKVFEDKSLLLKYEELLNALSELYITDIPKELIQQLIKNQINDMSKWTIIKQSVNGTGASKQTYSMPGMNLYVMEPDMNTVALATKKINEIKNQTKEAKNN